MYIKEGKGKLALFCTASNALLTPLLFIFYFPPPLPPPSPHFYCGVQEGYSRGTGGVQEGYRRGTEGVQEGYSRGTGRVQEG